MRNGRWTLDIDTSGDEAAFELGLHYGTFQTTVLRVSAEDMWHLTTMLKEATPAIRHSAATTPPAVMHHPQCALSPTHEASCCVFVGREFAPTPVAGWPRRG